MSRLLSTRLRLVLLALLLVLDQQGALLHELGPLRHGARHGVCRARGRMSGHVFQLPPQVWQQEEGNLGFPSIIVAHFFSNVFGQLNPLTFDMKDASKLVPVPDFLQNGREPGARTTFARHYSPSNIVAQCPSMIVGGHTTSSSRG